MYLWILLTSINDNTALTTNAYRIRQCYRLFCGAGHIFPESDRDLMKTGVGIRVDGEC